MDAACKDHDIAYSKHSNSRERYEADKVLTKRAFKRIFSRKAGVGERAASILVSGLMGAKMGLSKLGLGLNKKGKNIRKKSKNNRKNKTLKKKKIASKSITFNSLVNASKSVIKKSKGKPLESIIKASVQSAHQKKQNNKLKKPSRVLKLPKIGGFLSILPILSGLSAIGSITSSVAGIASALRKIESAKKRFTKERTDGEAKIGNGLSLVYKAKGSGIYLKPYKRQSDN